MTKNEYTEWWENGQKKLVMKNDPKGGKPSVARWYEDGKPEPLLQEEFPRSEFKYIHEPKPK